MNSGSYFKCMVVQHSIVWRKLTLQLPGGCKQDKYLHVGYSGIVLPKCCENIKAITFSQAIFTFTSKHCPKPLKALVFRLHKEQCCLMLCFSFTDLYTCANPPLSLSCDVEFLNITFQ